MDKFQQLKENNIDSEVKQHIRNALKNWNVADLGKNPLAKTPIVATWCQNAGREDTELNRGMTLQEILRAAINLLKPADKDDQHLQNKEWQRYVIIEERYTTRQRTQQSIADSLQMGRRTLQRQEKEAIKRIVENFHKMKEPYSLVHVQLGSEQEPTRREDPALVNQTNQSHVQPSNLKEKPFKLRNIFEEFQRKTVYVVLIALIFAVAGLGIVIEDRLNILALFQEPPKPSPFSSICSPGTKCYTDEFTGLISHSWCPDPDNTIYSVKNSHLLLPADGNVGEISDNEFHPCAGFEYPLRFVDLTLGLDETTEANGRAYAGIEASVDRDHYFSFKIDSRGRAYIVHNLNEEANPPFQEFYELDDIDTLHTLRVEWTGKKILFFVDGNALDTEIPSSEYGHWFLINAIAQSGSSVVGKFDRIQWGISQ